MNLLRVAYRITNTEQWRTVFGKMAKTVPPSPLNRPDILAALGQASPFDLWQLSLAIEQMLKDSERNKTISSQLRTNQEVTYFDPRGNREISATVMEIHRSYALVKNHQDQKFWRIPFYMFPIDPRNTIQPKTQKLDRLHLKVADHVGFLDRSGQAQYGKVTKLNSKTAEVTLPTGERWRVFYHSLFQVLETEGYSYQESLQIRKA